MDTIMKTDTWDCRNCGQRKRYTYDKLCTCTECGWLGCNGCWNDAEHVKCHDILNSEGMKPCNHGK